MSRLLLIRHAQTDLAGTFCGHSDPWLNKGGYEQIDRMIDKLAEEPIDAIYTSDLLRATHTAQVIAHMHDLPLNRIASLREIHFGDFEGLTWQQIEKQHFAAAHHWLKHHRTSAPPNGECFPDFQQRVVAATRQIVCDHPGCVALVTHGGAIRVILEDLGGHSAASAAELSQEHCRIIPLELHS